MLNETIFLIITLLDLAFILLMFRFGKEGLFAAIVTNIILVSTLGAKLVDMFGFTTNAGNVFYAAVFVAANMLNEHYGRHAAYRSIWIGFVSLTLFVLMGEFTVRTVGSIPTLAVNEAIELLFGAVPRIALASMVAYLVSQNLNVYLYDFVRQKTGPASLWLRNVSSQTVGQAVDSALFFSIAFLGTVSTDVLLQTMVIGFLLKTAVGLISTPFLYASNVVKEE